MISRNSQENKPKACNFNKKETLTQVFPCEFCEIIKNIFFKEYIRATASAYQSIVRKALKIDTLKNYHYRKMTFQVVFSGLFLIKDKTKNEKNLNIRKSIRNIHC